MVNRNNFIAVFLTVILICFGSLSFVGCGNDYKDGYKSGYDEGYTRGVREGQGGGYSAGKAEGQRAGAEQAKRDAANGEAIRGYYPFLFWSFWAACISGIALQYILKINLRKDKKIKDIHKLFIPGIKCTKAYILLQDLYSDYYQPLIKNFTKTATEIVSSKLQTEEKRTILTNKLNLYKEKIESKQHISEFFDDRFIEQAKNEFDKIVEDMDFAKGNPKEEQDDVKRQ